MRCPFRGRLWWRYSVDLGEPVSAERSARVAEGELDTDVEVDPRGGGWISVNGVVDADLGRELTQRVKARVIDGAYTWEEVRHLAQLELRQVRGSLTTSNQRLEMLRQLCQLWDVDIHPREISSHRPVIGPVIVAAKRVLFRLLKVLLRDSIRQQRDFNATVISILTEMSNEERAAVGDDAAGRPPHSTIAPNARRS